MNQIMIESFELWADTEEYRNRINKTRDVINEALRRYNHPYIAYSGGKDSLVMLHLVLQQVPGIAVWHWDYGRTLIPRWLEAEIIAIAKTIGCKEIIINERGKPNTARLDHAYGYRAFFATLHQTRVKKGWDLGFVGIRREESTRRKRVYTSFFSNSACFPLLNLTWKDVWSYIISSNIPYPSVYDRYASVLGYDKVRLVTFFDNEFEKLGAPYIDGVLMPEFRNVE